MEPGALAGSEESIGMVNYFPENQASMEPGALAGSEGRGAQPLIGSDFSS